MKSERNRFGNHPHHAFVIGVFKAGSGDDIMKLIGRLFVRTGNTRSSDVWQHFGPLTVSRPEPLSNIQPQSIDAVAGIAK